MTIEKLRRIFGLSHPGTVRLVDRMIKENLVEKRSSTVDRRAVALFLSDKGEKLCNEILNARQVRLAETLALLEQDERKTYINLTKKLLLGTIKNENHANSICRLCDAVVCENCPVESGINIVSVQKAVQ